MPQQKYLARIHIMKKEKAVPEERYRDILWRKFRVTTSAALSDGQALVFIRLLRDFGSESDAASPEIIWKIEQDFHDICYPTDNFELRLRRFIFKIAKVSDKKFLDRRKAYEVVEAIKAIKARRHQEPAAS